MRWRRLLPTTLPAIAVLVVAVVGIAVLGGAVWLATAPRHGGGANNHWVGSSRIGGPFQLVDDNGKPVTQAALAGKPSVLYFGYTYCPEVCPTTLSDLAKWMRQLGPAADKLNYVFVTVDPARDTPKVMHEYVRSFDPRIRGFTGTPAQIAKIAKEYGVYYQKVPTEDGSYLMDHSSVLYLIGPDGGFHGLIPYQASDQAALAKLRGLIAAAPGTTS